MLYGDLFLAVDEFVDGFENLEVGKKDTDFK